MGRGVPHPSRNYRCICYCVAGIGETSGWLRLYPVAMGPELQTFDVIRVPIQKENAEKNRPETRKIYLNPPPKRVEHISDENIRLQTLKNALDSGTFLHDESWRGKKSLGLIQPLYPEFEIQGNKVIVRYRCNVSDCRGHINEVMGWSVINQRGGRGHVNHPQELEEEFLSLGRQHLLRRRQLWFVMGTLRVHPSRWILVDFHVTGMG